MINNELEIRHIFDKYKAFLSCKKDKMLAHIIQYSDFLINVLIYIK